MSDQSGDATRVIEWGVAASSCNLNDGLGDCYVVKPVRGGVLLAVVDGLGHGKQAAKAAQLAIDTVQEYTDGSIVSIFGRCHERLHSTRGAVMSLALFSAAAHTVTWAGVGNVEGLLLRRIGAGVHEDTLMLSSGVIGDRLPSVKAFTKNISFGDAVILSTDGIRPGFGEGLSLRSAPQEIANAILTSHRRPDDDALVLVARFVGV
jgi:hypothetical protein